MIENKNMVSVEFTSLILFYQVDSMKYFFGQGILFSQRWNEAFKSLTKNVMALHE